MVLLAVINPAAGKLNAASYLRDELTRVFRGEGVPYAVQETAYPGHASALVREFLDTHASEEATVFACGGDGTLNEVLNGTAHYPAARLSCIPCGTGNDFLRLFGHDAARFASVRELIHGDELCFDLIRCGGHYAINICSVGFDARIADKMQRFKRLPFVRDKGAYMLSTIRNLFHGLADSYRVTIDGESFDGEHTMLVAANGRCYGGGFYPVPDAVPDDGVLEFLVVGKVSPLHAASVLRMYENGRYRELSDIITHKRGRSMTVEARRPFAINCDGEIMRGSSVSFTLERARQRFVVPRGARVINEQIGDIARIGP